MLLSLDQLYYLLGKAVVLLGVLVLVLSLIVTLALIYSFKTRRFFFPRLILIGLSLVESFVKAIVWLARADDTIVDDMAISLQNYINREKFYATPVDGRFVFMPQCVRSVDCPAKLTPEGINCIHCGRCRIGEAQEIAEDLGYRFFVVPGSSFIKRIIVKYRPKAIVGVGCQMEIKEGLMLCHSHDIPAIGVPLSQSGCVATTLDWEKLYQVLKGWGS